MTADSSGGRQVELCGGSGVHRRMKTMRLFFFLLGAVLTLPVRAEPPVVPATPAPSADDPWNVIKDYTFQKRADFTAGAGRLTGKLAAQIREFKEKRASVPESSVKDWDFAMKDLAEAEVSLKSAIADLGDATSETWTQLKERVGDAWQRAKTACDKVRASTTS